MRLHILDNIQKRALKLTDDPAFFSKLLPLAHWRTVGLSLFYRYFLVFCLQELSSSISFLIFLLMITKHSIKTSFLANRRRYPTGSSRTHPCTVQLQKTRTSQFFRSFFPRLWVQLLADVLPSSQNLHLFKTMLIGLKHSSIFKPPRCINT